MTKCESRDGLVHHVFSTYLGAVMTMCSSESWSWRHPLDSNYNNDPRLVVQAHSLAVVTCLGCALGHVTA